MKSTTNISGLTISTKTFEDTVNWINNNFGTVYCCTMNEVVMASKDDEYRKILNKADLLTPDGMPLVWILKMRGIRAERVYGPELLQKFLISNIKIQKKQLFVGDEKNKNYFEKYGSYLTLPYKDEFNDNDYLNMIEVIKKSRAKIVWIGLGAKKQIVVADRLYRHLPNRVYITVGAAFDFLSGNKKQAPKWLRQVGGEWLYRLLSEPRRLRLRYLRILWYLIGGGR